MDEKPYQISISWHEDILQLVITGQTLSKKTADEIAQDVHNLVAEYELGKVLIDCRQVVGRLSITDTYYHVRDYPRPRHLPAKIAIVDSPENKSYYSFHETTAANVGVPMNYFSDISDAIKWLRQ